MMNAKLLLLTAVLVSAVSFGAPSTKKSAKAKNAKSNVTTSSTAPTTVVAPVDAPAASQAAPASAAAPVAGTSAAAVETAPAASAATVAVPAQSDSKVIGMIDIRPGYDIASEISTSENVVRLGYQFNKNTDIFYHQDFSGQKEVLKDMRLDTGRIYTNLRNIADFGNGLTLSYQNRLMLPVGQYLRDDGMVIVVRNYLNLKKDFGGGFAVTVSEAPFIPVYNQDFNQKGSKANPSFQNRVTVTPELNLINNRLSIALPIVWDATKRRGTDGAWDDALWINPEVDYALNDNFTIGLAYYNNNFINQGPEDGLAINFGEGFKNGVMQLVLITTL